MAPTNKARITDITDTVDPTVNDDITQGLDIRSKWINTTNGKVFFCVNNAAGAATWIDVTLTAAPGAHPVTIDTVDPTINDDSSLGFTVGDHWVNSAEETIWQAASVALGAAIWDRIDNAGGVGPGAAVNPNELMYGTLLDYPFAGNTTAGGIQYIRLELHKGTVSSMRTFIDSGGTGSRNIRMGIYDQVDPESEAGIPNNRVAQTNSVGTAGANGSFITEALIGGDYTVPVTGFYWLAIISDATPLKFAVTATHRADFLSVRHESGTGTTLPATAGTLSNPVNALIYLAAIKS